MRVTLTITLALVAAPSPSYAEEDSVLARFERSRVALTSFVGTGSFVTDRYSDDPFFSQSLTFSPRFTLFEHASASAGFELECELTEPSSATARRCAPSDLSLAIGHAELVRDPWLQGRLRGAFAIYLPTSLESRFNHTIMNLRATTGYSARFFEDHLSANISFSVQKYLPSRKSRGFAGEGGDSDFPLYFVRNSALGDGALGSGGRLNDNWAFISSAGVDWTFFDGLSLGVSFAIANYLRYSVPEDEFTDAELPAAGRADVTSGTIELSWSPVDHLGLDFGVTSAQPALTADNSSLRFPFYDFISPSNNFTRWYLAVHLTY